MLYEKFRHGINLGGWLSQYEIITMSEEEEICDAHFKSFITQDDIKQIAQWGLDHVRVPVDGHLFWDRQAECLKEKPMAYLDQCVSWCAKYGLNMIIDLHHIWGHVFGSMDKPVPLLTDEELSGIFCSFWEKMAQHYLGRDGLVIMFELFNEVADATGYLWNRLYKRTIRKIRQTDASRWILVGSNYINSVAYLDRLDLVEDPYVFYNFHFYEPNVFTHQRAHFSDEFTRYCHTLTYPGDMSAYQQFLQENPEYIKEHPLVMGEKYNDRVLMEKLMENAKQFLQYSGKELYCGEYGVIDTAPEEEAIKWLSDFIQLCNDSGIGRAMWNYKCLDFEMVDEKDALVRPGVLQVLREGNRS